MIKAERIIKTYLDGDDKEQVVVDVDDITIGDGEELVLVGPSGVGKTTLLHMLSGLVRPTSGNIYHDTVSIYELSERERDNWRANNVGYIFQKFNLIESMSVEENIMAGLFFAKRMIRSADYVRVKELMEQVGLSKVQGKKPFAISMGEQQRVAILRAVIKKPRILLADEPTANLDYENTEQVMMLLRELARQEGSACVVATHDERIQSMFAKRCVLQRGGGCVIC